MDIQQDAKSQVKNKSKRLSSEHLGRLREGRKKKPSGDCYLGVLCEEGEAKLELWCDKLNWIVVGGRQKHFFSGMDGLLNFYLNWMSKKKLLRKAPLRELRAMLEEFRRVGAELPLVERVFKGLAKQEAGNLGPRQV